MDLYSRRIVGWHIDKRMTTDLVMKAMIRAYNLRKPTKGLVFHSDRGSQYTSKRYRNLLVQFGMRASMGDVGASWDNAVVERFFGSLKHDWLLKVAQPTREHMKK
jgi:putative transposase